MPQRLQLHQHIRTFLGIQPRLILRRHFLQIDRIDNLAQQVRLPPQIRQILNRQQINLPLNFPVLTMALHTVQLKDRQHRIPLSTPPRQGRRKG